MNSFKADKPCLLIADDEPSVTDLLYNLLSEDYDCTTVSSGEEALTKLGSKSFALLLTDINMNGISGLEMIPQVRELSPDTIIVMISGERNLQSAVEAIRAGAFDYITKPFDLDQIEAAVSRAVKYYSLLVSKQNYENHLEELVVERTAELQSSNADLKRQIAERRRAEKALTKSEEHFRHIVETAQEGVWMLDEQAYTSYVNDRMGEILGFTADEMMGRSMYDFMDDESRIEAERNFKKRQAGIKGQHDFSFRRKDGSDLWAIVSASPVIGDDDTFVGVIGLVTDITDRKLIEEKLRENEEWLRTVFDASRDGISVEDEGVIIYANDAQAVLFGYEKAEELIGKKVHDLISPGEADLLTEYGTARLNDELRPTIYEFHGRRKDNSLIDLEASVSISTVGGKKYITTMMRDITKRKKYEQEIQVSEQRYRALITASAQVVWLADAAGRADFTTPAWQELTGQSVEEARGMGWLDAFHPESKKQSKRLWLEAVKNKTTYIDEQTVRTRDGSYRIFHTRGVPIFGDEGEIREWVGTLTDITDRKLTEQALRESERRFRELVEMLPVAVYTCDLTGAIEGYNQSAVTLWGRKPKKMDLADSFCGSYKIYTIDGVYLPHSECPTAEGLRTGKPIINEEIIVEQPDGTRRTAVVSVMPRRNERGKMTGAINCLVDITDRKQTEEKLRLSEEHLRQSQKMEAIGTLTGGVAHDFNNLLTAILGNTQLAQRKLSHDDPVRLCLNEVTEAGNRAADLTRKLLAFSRRQHLTRYAVNINDSLADTIALLERIIGADVEMSVKYAADLPMVFADAGQIEQVVMNLAVNSRDAMPDGGKLTIETSCVELGENYCRQYPYVVPGKYVQIKVSDTGKGMSKETRAHIFEPYFTTKEVGKGTGLGLAMAYGIVKQHDGHINLYSEPESGTTFKIYLPVSDKTVEEKNQAIPPSFFGGSETILVAEDEESLRKLAKDTLEDLGYTVLAAKNGEEAVELSRTYRGRIDLFLFDVVMPRMGGLEAYRQIGETSENIPIIFMSGYSSETVQNRFVNPEITSEKLGATIIQKPYTLDELGRIVRDVLDKNRQPLSRRMSSPNPVNEV